jgi:hypothetical protein
MIVDLIERQTADAVEFLDGGVVVGRLVWVAQVGDVHRPGWWLEGSGSPPALLFEAPVGHADDLEQARQESKSASLFFAKTMLTDRVGGVS